MGSYQSSYNYIEDVKINRIPIISPRHLPPDINIEDTRYARFNPKRYAYNFTFPLKALPKYT